MKRLLNLAFAEAAKLPGGEQEALAARILQEPPAERRWQEAVADSAEALPRFADETVAEHRAGGSRPPTITREAAWPTA